MSISWLPNASKKEGVFAGQRFPATARLAWLLMAMVMIWGVYSWLRGSSPGAAVARDERNVARPALHRGAEGGRRSRPPRAQRPATAAAPRVLYGRVQSERGRPIGGAQVCLVASLECCADPICVQSKRDGSFQVQGNAERSSVMFASHPDYLPISQTGLGPSDGKALVVTMKEGGAAIAGSVLDSAGGSIAGAQLRAADVGDRTIAFGVSDERGAFRLRVEPGPARIVARADGYSSMARQVNAPGDSVELTLTPSSSVRGRVLSEETDEPLADVEVTALNANGIGGHARSTTTNETGAFEILELSAGGYWVEAASARWRSDKRWILLDVDETETIDLRVGPATHVTASVRAGGAPCARGIVTLTRDPIAAVRALDPNGRVEFLGVLAGTYRAEVRCEPGMMLTEDIDVGLEPVARDWDLAPGLSLTGVVTTWAGAPLGGARVEVEPIGEPSWRRSVFCDSDERGAFTCLGLEPGHYDCELRENAVARSERVRVLVSESSTPPQIRLRAKPAATLSVRIENPESLALHAFAVVARAKGDGTRAAERKGGEFVFDQLPLGVYEVMIDPEVPEGRRTVELARAGAVVELSIAAPAARPLSGRVVDERGNGVPDAWVRVSGTSLDGALRPASPVMSDAEGVFSVPGLLAGTYQVNATSNQGEGLLEEVSNDGHPVIVPLRTYGSLSGSVTQSDGTPVPYFMVTYRRSPLGVFNQIPGHRGSWSTPWLEPGIYELTVTAAQGNARASVDVAPGRASTLALSLEPSPPR